MIPVTKPYIPNEKKYFKYIKEVNKREWLTNFGPLHNELTARMEDYLGVKNLLLVSNGTLALHIAYQALGLKNKVLTTPFTFVASTSSLVWEGLKPSFIDIDPKSLAINPKLLPAKTDASGMLAVHVYGIPADTKALDSYAKKNSLKMIYDGAHAFGVKKNGKSLLLAGDATTLSLHATKVFHTIEGGAIIFKDKSVFNTAKQMVNFGYDEGKEIRCVGTNSKLNEYQSAVGLVLLEEIDSIIERRVRIMDFYYSKLKDSLEVPQFDEKATLNGAYAPILLKDEKHLLHVVSEMNKVGIQTRRYFHPSLNEVPYFGKKVSCKISENIASRILCLPIYTTMSLKDQKYVVQNLLKII